MVLSVYEAMERALEFGEDLDADLVEVRGDDVGHITVSSEKMDVKDTRVFRLVGIGVRAYVRGATGYSYTTRLSKESVRDVVRNSVKSAKVASDYAKLKLRPAEYEAFKAEYPIKVKRHPTDVEFEEKKDMLLRGEEAAKDAGVDVATTRASYGEASGTKFFMNSEGADIRREVLLVSIGATVVSRRGDVLVDAYDSHGGTLGLEAFEDEYSPEKLGQNAGKWAAEKLTGKKPPAGRFRALIDSNLAGVMAHESFGHMSEYDFVMTGGSPLAGKLNEKLGSESATIIDEGIVDLPKYPGFRLPYDDEGVKAKPVLLLDRGILKAYLHQRGTAGAAQVEPTGNGRSVDYRFEPICRMRNTYFARGDLTVEEGMELLDEGIYACSTAGGQVSLDGTFMFKAVRGYWVEGGEPKYAFRDVAIRGHILDFLKNILERCNDLKIHSGYFGGCGKGGQYPLAVGLGGPHVLLEQAAFGGEQS